MTTTVKSKKRIKVTTTKAAKKAATSLKDTKDATGFLDNKKLQNLIKKEFGKNEEFIGRLQHMIAQQELIEEERKVMAKHAEKIAEYQNESDKVFNVLSSVLEKAGFEGKHEIESILITMKKTEQTIIIDATKVPQDLCVHIPESWNPDKNLVKAKLKQLGKKTTRYAQLRTNYSLTVKKVKKEVRN